MILRRGQLTAEIALISVVLSWLVGIPVAIVSALRPNTADSAARFVSILFLAVPALGRHADRARPVVLVRLSRANDRRFAVRRPLGQFSAVIGPAVVLGLGQAAYIACMGRSSLLEVIREDYVRRRAPKD